MRSWAFFETLAGIFSVLGRPVCVAGPRGDIRTWLTLSGMAKPNGDLLGTLAEAIRWRPLPLLQRSIEAAGVAGRVALMPHPKVSRAAEEIPRLDRRPTPIVNRRPYPGSPIPLVFVRCPLSLSETPLADIDPPPKRGADTHDTLARIGVDVAADSGVVPYPPDKPFPVWLLSFVRWGYFAWKSGNI